jgi:hypothetical protein
VTHSKKIFIELLILTILLVGVVFVASASTNDLTVVSSEGEVSGINEQGLNDMQIPDFGPKTLENLNKDSKILTTEGQIPQYTTQIERRNWLNKLDKTRLTLGDDINPYVYPKGPIIGYGININGYFEVILYENMNITDPQINEIYNVISKRANEVSIKKVPVVFGKSDFIQNEVSGYNTYYRPIIGAIKVTGETGSWATIGYAAKTSSGTKGYVTVQHLGTYVGYDMYQPESDAAGSVSKISNHSADACFVPYSNVAAKIHIGNGVTKNINSYVSSIPSNSWTSWGVFMSGTTSGVKSGNVVGWGNLTDAGGMIYTNMVKADYTSQGGDSGAPIYRVIPTTSEYRLVGVHKGNFYGYTWFSPISGVISDLGVTPLTA